MYIHTCDLVLVQVSLQVAVVRAAKDSLIFRELLHASEGKSKSHQLLQTAARGSFRPSTRGDGIHLLASKFDTLLTEV